MFDTTGRLPNCVPEIRELLKRYPDACNRIRELEALGRRRRVQRRPALALSLRRGQVVLRAWPPSGPAEPILSEFIAGSSSPPRRA